MRHTARRPPSHPTPHPHTHPYAHTRPYTYSANSRVRVPPVSAHGSLAGAWDARESARPAQLRAMGRAGGGAGAGADALALARWAALLGVSAPAVALQVAVPLCGAVTTALLGRTGRRGELGAYAAATTVFNFITQLFAFLVDGYVRKHRPHR